MGKKKKGGHKGESVTSIISLITAVLLLAEAIIDLISRLME